MKTQSIAAARDAAGLPHYGGLPARDDISLNLGGLFVVMRNTSSPDGLSHRTSLASSLV
jgi:hypothetical protein